MRKALVGLLILFGLASPALAQTKFTLPPPAGTTVMGIQVVSSCGSASGLVAGNLAYVAMDTTGVLCTSAGGGGGGGTSSTFGAAFPATGTAAGFTDGTNMVAGRVRNPGSGALVGDAAIVVADPNVLAAVNSPVPAGTNLIGDVNLRQGGTALSVTNGIYANLLVGNAAVATGTGAIGSTVPRFGVATDQATNAGAALVKGGVGTVNGGSDYETVAASQTAQALGATGATGDYLSHCVLQPTTTAAGTMTILDNATVIFTFTTGTLSNLAPIAIPVGANSVSGAWKVTTGANETVTCFGKFT